MAYIAHVVTGVWCGEVVICDVRVCVLAVSSRSSIFFKPSARAITGHGQSAKDMDPLFLVPALCGRPPPPKAATHFIEWAEDTRRASAPQKFNFCRG